MKITISCAVILALALTCNLVAQAPRQSGTPSTRVAVIDISKVFKSHPRFKQAMESLKNEVKSFETELRARAKEIETLRGQMQQYETGSAEYKQIETKMMKIQADGQIAATQQKKVFMEREAQIYYGVYNEIAGEVARFAQQNGIGLVVRYNSDPIDPSMRQSVLEGVNRAVIYQQNSNITNAIIARITQKQGAPAAEAASGPKTRR